MKCKSVTPPASVVTFFCSVPCWDAHVPMMRHRESWTEQHTAPNRVAWERDQQAEQAPNASRTSEILIVVSKLKQYIKQQAGMNTSDVVRGVLSDHLRHLCDQAIAYAAEEGRKTVMERDFEPFLDIRQWEDSSK